MSTVDVPAAHSSALGASVAKKALNRDVVDPSPEQGEVSVFSNGEFQGTAAEIREKYNQERNKRERLDGNGQYIPAMSTAKYAHFSGDPWNPAQPNVDGTWSSLLEADAHVKYLIVGAGFGGLLMAIHLVQAGISVKDIRIVDRAHGFGGTWYWSRFPGTYSFPVFNSVPQLICFDRHCVRHGIVHLSTSSRGDWICTQDKIRHWQRDPIVCRSFSVVVQKTWSPR